MRCVIWGRLWLTMCLNVTMDSTSLISGVTREPNWVSSIANVVKDNEQMIIWNKSDYIIYTPLKVTFSFHIITTKRHSNANLILISHFTWILQWFIILDMNNLVNVTHHYWMLLKLSIKLKFFLEKILQKSSQGPTKVHFFHKNKQVGEMVILMT